jgi:diguanylate cyclase (GGDEF)-like protein/PAS domain S-box-containing protein
VSNASARKAQLPTMRFEGAEEALRQSEEKFRLLVQGVKDYAIFILDPQGLVTTWNEGAERIKGYRAEEIIGEHFSRSYTPEDVATGHPALELKIAAEQGRFEEEGWRVRSDGSRFWANVVITAMRDETGQLRGFGKITRDITAHKQAQEVLRQSEEKFRLLVQEVKDYAIFMLDPEGRVVTWNEGAQRIKGFRADEIVGQHFSRFYTPEAVATGHPAFELRVATDQGRFEEEGWRVHKDGSRFWANVVITALRDEGGHLRGFGKVTRDITARKQAESNLRLLSERLSLATGVAKVGVWEWDLATDTLTWDDTMFEIYGLPSVVPMPYKKWSAAVHPDDLPDSEARLRRAIDERGGATLEFRILRTDGSLRNVSAICRVVFDEPTNVTRLIGVNTDVTERTNTETALRESEARMAKSAQHDFLTGLPNRVLLNDRVNQAIAMASRHGKRIAVLSLDLDGFKDINDTLGHAIGDKVLQSIAKRLAGCVRASDTVSRLGGDEFVVLLSEVEEMRDVAITTKKILEAVSNARWVDLYDLYVTISIGVSVYPDNGLDAETLIHNADAAMYQIKKNGRKGYQFFSPDMNNIPEGGRDA